jgi:hypothetical protein
MHDALVCIHRLREVPPIAIAAPPIREGPCDMSVLCLPRVYHERLRESRIEEIMRLIIKLGGQATNIETVMRETNKAPFR